MVRRLKAGERLRDVAEAIDLRTTTVRRWWRRHWGWSSLRIARDLPVPLPIVRYERAASASAFLVAAHRWYAREGGRASVRAVLYMAATACMRKLLTILNAMVHQQRRWDPELG